MTQPQQPQVEAALQVLWYLKGTPGQSICMSTSDIHHSTYCELIGLVPNDKVFTHWLL